MPIKSKIITLVLCILNLFIFNLDVSADEFNISAVEISVDKKNNIVIGKGSVEATDQEGRLIKADKIIYEKSKEFLTAEGSVLVNDNEGNIIVTNKATYDKMQDIIITFKNSQLNLKEGYKLKSNKILYNNLKRTISSDQKTSQQDRSSINWKTFARIEGVRN